MAIIPTARANQELSRMRDYSLGERIPPETREVLMGIRVEEGKPATPMDTARAGIAAMKAPVSVVKRDAAPPQPVGPKPTVADLPPIPAVLLALPATATTGERVRALYREGLTDRSVIYGLIERHTGKRPKQAFEHYLREPAATGTPKTPPEAPPEPIRIIPPAPPPPVVDDPAWDAPPPVQPPAPPPMHAVLEAQRGWKEALADRERENTTALLAELSRMVGGLGAQLTGLEQRLEHKPDDAIARLAEAFTGQLDSLKRQLDARVEEKVAQALEVAVRWLREHH